MRWTAGVVALPLTMLGFVFSTPTAHATEQTAIDAKIGPSLVYINTSYTASLQIPEGVIDDRSHWAGPVTVGGTCTGVVVDPAGYIATDGHCVDPTSLDTKEELVTAILLGDGNFRGLINILDLDRDTARRFLNTAIHGEWPIEGKDPAAPPDRTVQVIQPQGPGRVISEWTTAQVVDFQKADVEDNALLKVSNVGKLAALPVASEVPAPGTAVTSAGFPGDVGDTMDKSRSQPPSFKEGSVSSKQVQENGAARTEVSSTQTNGMSGGPVLDNATGEVIGLCDYGIRNRQTGQIEGGINFATDASALHSFLLKNGVHMVAPPAPAKSSFPWLWIAVGGAAVVVLLLTLPVVLVVRRRAKRRSVPRIDGSQLLQLAPAGQPLTQPLPAPQGSPTGTPQPPRDLQSDSAAAKPDELASIAPGVMTPTPNGTRETQ
jgi:hypothetical protein